MQSRIFSYQPNTYYFCFHINSLKFYVQLIIMEHCALNAVDHNKNTALFYAVRDKEEHIVDVLLCTGPYVKDVKNPPDMSLKFGDEEYTYLHFAAWYRAPKIVRALLRRKADVNVLGRDKHSPLSLACRSNHHRDNIILTLLKAGAKVNTADKNDNTPLHYAAFNGNKGAVEELVKRGAAIDALNNEKATALWNAVYHKHEEIVLLLLDKNADYNVKSRGLSTVKFTDITGRYYQEPKSAFYVACEKSERGNASSETIVKALVAAGVNLEAESWFWGLDGNERPPNLRDNTDLIYWIIRQAQAVRSLQEICGLAIRRRCGANLDRVDDHYPNMPFKIRQFVQESMSIHKRLAMIA